MKICRGYSRGRPTRRKGERLIIGLTAVQDKDTLNRFVDVQFNRRLIARRPASVILRRPPLSLVLSDRVPLSNLSESNLLRSKACRPLSRRRTGHRLASHLKIAPRPHANSNFPTLVQLHISLFLFYGLDTSSERPTRISSASRTSLTC